MIATQYTEYLYKCPGCRATFMAADDARHIVECPFCGVEFWAKDQLVEGVA